MASTRARVSHAGAVPARYSGLRACVSVFTHPVVRCGVLPAGSVAILELRQARIQLLPQQQTVSTGPWPTTTIHTPVAYQPLGVLPSSASTSGGLSRRSGCLV